METNVMLGCSMDTCIKPIWTMIKKNNIIYTKRVNYYLHFNWGWDGICNGYFSPDFVGINNSQYADKKHQKNLSFNIKDDFADFYLLKNHAAQ